MNLFQIKVVNLKKKYDLKIRLICDSNASFCWGHNPKHDEDDVPKKRKP